jgi:broad specificity phosphatase PhoE
MLLESSMLMYPISNNLMLTNPSAGVRDSPLTNHGVLQASRLGAHLATWKISHIFSSDLQRAFHTAESIRVAQHVPPTEVTKLEILREQDFGFYEGKKFFERPQSSDKTGREAHLELHRNDPGFKDVESHESMSTRMGVFIMSHLSLHIEGRAEDETVAIVAHGIILNYLWRGILQRFDQRNVSIAPELDRLGRWMNTAYMDLEIKKLSIAPGMSMQNFAAIIGAVQSPNWASFPNLTLLVKASNCQFHLRGLKKTRGGLGNLKHDEKQKTMDSFFQKKEETEKTESKVRQEKKERRREKVEKRLKESGWKV